MWNGYLLQKNNKNFLNSWVIFLALIDNNDSNLKPVNITKQYAINIAKALRQKKVRNNF